MWSPLNQDGPQTEEILLRGEVKTPPPWLAAWSLVEVGDRISPSMQNSRKVRLQLSGGRWQNKPVPSGSPDQGVDPLSSTTLVHCVTGALAQSTQVCVPYPLVPP